MSSRWINGENDSGDVVERDVRQKTLSSVLEFNNSSSTHHRRPESMNGAYTVCENLMDDEDDEDYCFLAKVVPSPFLPRFPSCLVPRTQAQLQKRIKRRRNMGNDGTQQRVEKIVVVDLCGDDDDDPPRPPILTVARERIVENGNSRAVAVATQSSAHANRDQNIQRTTTLNPTNNSDDSPDRKKSPRQNSNRTHKPSIRPQNTTSPQHTTSLQHTRSQQHSGQDSSFSYLRKSATVYGSASRVQQTMANGLGDNVSRKRREYQDSFFSLEYFWRDLNPTERAPKSLSLQDFIERWENITRLNGHNSTEEMEHGRKVRGANQRVDKTDSAGQAKAQYGRLLPQATDNLLRNILKVDQNEIFVDLGHGIGNVVLQAAYTIGCESRGIEVIKDRHVISLQYKCKLQEDASLKNIAVGDVDLRNGRLEDPKNRELLTDMGSRVIKAFCNNFNGCYAQGSAKKVDEHTLDDYVAGLFASMKEGSKLATLHQLSFHVGSKSKADDDRDRHHLAQSHNASFYDMETVELGPQNECVSWSQGGGCTRPVVVYVYTRVGSSEFTCGNPVCDEAWAAKLQDAYQLVGCGDNQRLILNLCQCATSRKTTRERKPADRYGP